MTGVRLPAEAWEDVDDGVAGLLEEWLVSEGDAVDAGQPIASVIVLKTSMEVVAPVAGTVDSIAVAAGETFGPDDDLALIVPAQAGEAGVGTKNAPAAEAVDEKRGGEGRIPFTGVRGAVARNMAAAWQNPRVAAGVEVDMRAALELLARSQEKLGEGLKLTPTHLVIQALVLTLAEHPRLNGVVEEDGVEPASEISIGLAVSLEEGVIVPVLHDVASMPIERIVTESARLAEGARAGELGGAELSGGSFTVSTLGSAGIDWFTPVLNSPQIAILGVGAIAERPLAVDGTVIAASTMELTLVYDHRAVDGHPASLMLAALRSRLERADLGLDA